MGSKVAERSFRPPTTVAGVKRTVEHRRFGQTGGGAPVALAKQTVPVQTASVTPLRSAKRPGFLNKDLLPRGQELSFRRKGCSIPATIPENAALSRRRLVLT